MSTRPQTLRRAWALHQAAMAVDGHEHGTLDALARRLAMLLGHDYQGMRDASEDPMPGPSYFVPERTLLLPQARALGICSSQELFGGVVPHAFVATKVISHPALDDADSLPTGWARALAGHLAGNVLPGFAVFSARHARRAYAMLCTRGPLRFKAARGIGGRGQTLLQHADELDAVLHAFPSHELHAHGAVIELHLYEPQTWSVGWAECGPFRIAYVGSQRLVRNRRDEEVYGGSDLVVSREGFEALRRDGVDAALQRGMEQARNYHSAVAGCFPDFFASRCNYDVIDGRDRDGRRRSGVLEQSWRIGGASPAEIAALRAFADDPSLDVVHASSHEAHGPCTVPAGADVHYHGADPEWGRMTKYSTVARHGH